MIQHHPWLVLAAAALLAAGVLAIWQPDWARYREVGDVEVRWEGMNVGVDSLPPYRYHADWSSYTEQNQVTWGGDSLLSAILSDGFVNLTAASFSECDHGVVVPTDSTLVPIAPGNTTCVVKSGVLLDTLHLGVRDCGGQLVIIENKGRRAS